LGASGRRICQGDEADPDFIPVADFRELPEHELSALGDEQLIAYLRAARAAGRHDAMKPAVAVLVFGYHANLVNRARLKLPEADIEDVVSEAIASAIASAFDGTSVGEFRSWLHTILSRRIADYHEARSRRPKTAPLPGEDEETWGHEPRVAPEGDALFARTCILHALDELRDQRHRRVIDLYVLGPHAAGETAALMGDGMTEANVHQISSRFERRVKELLEEGGDTQD
jgi:RNA polymerase sigma factor (sigma-70 family)